MPNFDEPIPLADVSSIVGVGSEEVVGKDSSAYSPAPAGFVHDEDELRRWRESEVILFERLACCVERVAEISERLVSLLRFVESQAAASGGSAAEAASPGEPEETLEE
jgi:hypothetical protein